MRRSLIAIIMCNLSFLYSYSYAQWTEPVRIGAPGGVLYPQILAQGDTLHVVYSNNYQGWKIGYVRSTNAGDSWTDQQVLSDDSSETVFVRILENGPRLMVLWRNNYYYGGSRSRNIGYNISDDNGLAWSGPQYVLDPGWSHILYFSASGNGPKVNVILSSRIDHDLVFFNVRSTNFGQSWLEPVELFRAVQSSLTDQASFNNMVHYVWGGRFNWESRWETYYVRSTDEGISWSENIALSEEDQYHSYSPSLWADEQGFLVSSWFDYKYSPYFLTGDILLRQSADSGNTWLAEQQITRNHLAMGGSDVVSDGDTINIVWEDMGEGLDGRSIYYSRSVDFGASWSEPFWLDGTDDDSWNPALAMSNSSVYVVWAEERDDPGIGLYFSRYRDQTDIIDEDIIKPGLEMLQAYPNPFNSSTIITYNRLEGGEIEIYNIVGQKIRSIKPVTKEGKIIWDARDALGNKVSSGIYFARARNNKNFVSIKLLYLK